MISALNTSAQTCFSIQTRNMATLKDIAIRLKSVTNIQKITKSMKMVSAAKFARAERELKPARPYGNGAKAFYEKAEVAPTSDSATGDNAAGPQHLIISVTSDRGLCGAANSSIVKTIRAYLAENPSELGNTRIVAIGDKSRAMLHRQYGKQLLMQVNEIGKKPPTFADASTIMNAVVQATTEAPFTHATMYFNTFRSVVSYKTTLQPLYSMESVMGSPKLPLYDSVDDEVMRDYNEFLMASLMFYALKESNTSEQSARMTAMDAASKNAGEMIDKLRLDYNRTRQAAITRELIEIISGAAAV